MASLQRRSSGLYVLAFRFGGTRHLRSLETSDEGEATRLKEVIQDRLKALDKGTLVLPEGACSDDLWSILQSGRLPVSQPKLIKSVTLKAAADGYLKSYPAGSKEADTLATETVHLNNLKRLIGDRRGLHTIVPSDLTTYITERQKEDGHRGGKIRSDTIRKELQTFRLLWTYGKGRGCVSAECPLDEISLPKRHRKPPFQTRVQIERTIARGGLTQQKIAELWECLFLSEAEVAEFLQHIKDAAQNFHRFRYIYAALCFCAWTGARRSEMFRCLVDDVADDNVTIREKKRDTDIDYTFRNVPVSPQLKSVLDAWVADHPGGQFLFCKNGGQPLDDRTSREAFKAATNDSKWSVLRGYHVLRHSFASNLARSGKVSQALIDELMGHQTEEMRFRYRHLFPEDKRAAVEVLGYTKTG